MRHVDGLIGELEEKIKATKLPVDLIVVSDHGMVKLEDRKWVALDQMVNLEGVKSADSLMYPTTEAEKQRIYEELKAKNDPRFAVYRLKDMPERLHYNANEREGDPVVEPLKAVPITVHAKTAEIGAKGEHGWDPRLMPEMKAIFYAEGPDIKAGVKLQPFENVNIYDFVAGILGLNPAKNDGDRDGAETGSTLALQSAKAHDWRALALYRIRCPGLEDGDPEEWHEGNRGPADGGASFAPGPLKQPQ